MLLTSQRVRCWVAYLYATERDSIAYELPEEDESAEVVADRAERMARAEEALAAIDADINTAPPTDEEWQGHVQALLGGT